MHCYLRSHQSFFVMDFKCNFCIFILLSKKASIQNVNCSYLSLSGNMFIIKSNTSLTFFSLKAFCLRDLFKEEYIKLLCTRFFKIYVRVAEFNMLTIELFLWRTIEP